MDDSKDGPATLVRCPFCGKLNRVRLDRAADRPACGECSKPLLMDRPVPIADTDLDRIITESDVPVVVDFYADWCGPCKVMAPLLDDVARTRIGTLLVGKLDTDRYPASTQRFGIRGIPTLIIFHGGREVARQVGLVPRAKLDEIIDRIAGHAAG
ncbi:MAG: thioredoxin [Gemmatimonadetes bacterium]|nr:thioredoxin [Gemmatimonadota bacterium]